MQDCDAKPGTLTGGYSPYKQVDSFGEGKSQLPRYFQQFNEEGIEKKNNDNDDLSNIAEARDILKALNNQGMTTEFRNS